MSDNQWGCPCCGYVGNERLEIEKLTSRVAELEAALENIKKHQESVFVGMPQLSSTWLIAVRALEQ